jgi:hypothetical protein
MIEPGTRGKYLYAEALKSALAGENMADRGQELAMLGMRSGMTARQAYRHIARAIVRANRLRQNGKSVNSRALAQQSRDTELIDAKQQRTSSANVWKRPRQRARTGCRGSSRTAALAQNNILG